MGGTWGMAKGLGLAPIRTMVGIVDVITFPVPSNHYEPVMQPAIPFAYFFDYKPQTVKQKDIYILPSNQAAGPWLTQMGPGPLDYEPAPRR